jgi:hypothetical protein
MASTFNSLAWGGICAKRKMASWLVDKLSETPISVILLNIKAKFYFFWAMAVWFA